MGTEQPMSADMKPAAAGSMEAEQPISAGVAPAVASTLVLEQQIGDGGSASSVSPQPVVMRQSRPTTLLHMDDEDVRRRSMSVNEAKEQAYGKLKDELTKVQRELKLKGAECERLEHVRCQIEAEVEELTASLFEEANKMVQEANIKRMHTEKLLSESTNKVEVLEAEVAALKTLVITSTPSMPNAHLHPQINDSSVAAAAAAQKSSKLTRQDSNRSVKHDATAASNDAEKKSLSFKKSHRRSTSHHAVKVELQSPDREEPVKKTREENPTLFEEFTAWRQQPVLSNQCAFLARVLHEDIEPCLSFSSQDLSQAAVLSIQDNALSIEPISEAKRTHKLCALTERLGQCCYRIRLAETDSWHDVCEHARNRIAAVCDFYTYIRYIKQGLVKSCDEDAYWHIIELRKQMCCCRLGLTS